MTTKSLDSQIEELAKARLDRRKFFRQAGFFGLGAAASGVMLSGVPAKAQQNTNQIRDTTTEMFTAFLIAEDLASTMYYNALVGALIQDPALAGAGGSAKNVTTGGNFGNVQYLRAALGQEISHANLFRGLLTGAATNYTADPHQTFYFPAGTFDTLANFLPILNALENAFIGAYLVLIQELSYKAVLASSGALTGWDAKYTARQYELFAKIAGSIMGVECEHRVLGRVIGNNNPANNLLGEQTDGLTAIYNGPSSAVVALTPFLTSTTGPGFSLQTALMNRREVSLDTTGGVPTS